MTTPPPYPYPLGVGFLRGSYGPIIETPEDRIIYERAHEAGLRAARLSKGEN